MTAKIKRQDCMVRRYIKVKGTFGQDTADNWLLMIPAERLSSDSKIVYLVLKKMQDSDCSSQTDANSWYKISGLPMKRVNECLAELEDFGLIERYYSTRNLKVERTVCTNYLLDHFLMKNCYNIVDCPHECDSFPNPAEAENLLRNSKAAKMIASVKASGDRISEEREINQGKVSRYKKIFAKMDAKPTNKE